uniref:Uncharacterized protein n=1 Tax=Caenorhabditis japonica TaxID=281687 RepID=A0A8R1EDE3_CAEJA
MYHWTDGHYCNVMTTKMFVQCVDKKSKDEKKKKKVETKKKKKRLALFSSVRPFDRPSVPSCFLPPLGHGKLSISSSIYCNCTFYIILQFTRRCFGLHFTSLHFNSFRLQNPSSEICDVRNV